jgi:hypothetical protein
MSLPAKGAQHGNFRIGPPRPFGTAAHQGLSARGAKTDNRSMVGAKRPNYALREVAIGLRVVTLDTSSRSWRIGVGQSSEIVPRTVTELPNGVRNAELGGIEGPSPSRCASACPTSSGSGSSHRQPDRGVDADNSLSGGRHRRFFGIEPADLSLLHLYVHLRRPGRRWPRVVP